MREDGNKKAPKIVEALNVFSSQDFIVFMKFEKHLGIKKPPD